MASLSVTQFTNASLPTTILAVGFIAIVVLLTIDTALPLAVIAENAIFPPSIGDSNKIVASMNVNNLTLNPDTNYGSPLIMLL